MIGYGSAAHLSSVWSKSVVQSETGPVTTSLLNPIGSSSKSSARDANRSSTGGRASCSVTVSPP